MENTSIKREFVLKWSTDDELRFIDGAGTFGCFGATRVELLSNYIAVAEERFNWDNIDKNIVIQYAKKSLSKCQKELNKKIKRR